jgi:hypothetical protein
MKRSKLTAEITKRDTVPEEWAVEAIDMEGDGSVEMAIFIGPDARQRAIEYAEQKYADHRSAKAA